MTVLEKLEYMLQENGMSSSQAKEVMKLALPKLNDLDDYKITFDSDESAYPKEIYRVLFNFTKPVALKWINNNIPQAWYKPMFE